MNTTSNQQAEVLQKLSAIIDPDLGKDVVTLGFIKNLEIGNDGQVSFAMELTTPACPLKDSFQKRAEELVGELSWVRSVSIQMTAQKRHFQTRSKTPGLSRVKHIIAVSSCKGGVGKSTVAVNLAYSLAQTGSEIGLFDADIYGPSLPTMVSSENTELQSRGDLIEPLVVDGVKLMSYGYAARDKDRAAIMRGPMVSGVVTQLAGTTDWGELDYLIVDLPPGTGDIQLTLTQQLSISGAVIVTTPQKLSFVDVVKGMQMFETVKVPILAVVENMSYFVCGDCTAKHYPFGHGAKTKLQTQYGIGNAFEIPMHEALSKQSDQGIPIVVGEPKGEHARLYQQIAGGVVRELARLEHGAITRFAVRFEPSKGILMSNNGEAPIVLDPRVVRLGCRCAGCIDEFSGEKRLDESQVAADVHPVNIEPRGNYAVAVAWSDGHNSSIYPFERLIEIAAV